MAESSTQEIDKLSLIQQYVSLTDSDNDTATHLLEALGWNLESAVNMYFDGGGTATATTSNQQNDDEISEVLSAFSPQYTSGKGKNTSFKKKNNPILVEDTPQSASTIKHISERVDVDDYVRAPIPQRQAVLVEDQYHALPYPQKRRQPTSRNVFDGLRDFKKETEEQERLLLDGRSASTVRKTKRLHELFQPPVDIMHNGDFQSARSRCTLNNRWLLINVQDTTEFASQVLNRDVWSNPIVREIINENFILWQVLRDSDEGQHYGTFYKIGSYPHLAVIDPRTGERMVIWENLGVKPSANQFAELATLFLSDNPSLKGETSDSEVDLKVTTDVDSSTIIDRSEDAQLEAAIQASLQMKNVYSNVISVRDEDDRSDDDDDDDDDCIEVDNDVNGDVNGQSSHSNYVTKIDSDAEKNKQPRKKRKLENDTNSPVADERPRLKEAKEQKSTKENTDVQPGNNALRGGIQAVSKEITSNVEQVKILLRMPTSERKQIVIALGSTLEDLAKEVSTLGWSSSRYELVKSFPRQNLSSLNQQLTLKEVGLHKQETLFIQDR